MVVSGKAEKTTAQEVEAGYFVPEVAWLNLEGAMNMLKGMSDMADGPARDVAIRSDQLTTLLDAATGRLKIAMKAARFVA